MKFPIGEIIRTSRQRLGWDQAELARRLGDVGQQTISRWERGTSRPRRRMVGQLAEVLELPVGELLAAAGYVAATADTPDQIKRPVRPRMASLPLADLTAERFEQFVADLAHLFYPKAKISRFGGQGHKQAGIDVLAVRGRRTEATFQCKREKRFGPAKVRAAIAAVQVQAGQHFLMLSRVASPGARAEVAKHNDWTILDVEDISRRVRLNLPKDAAVRLIDTHFPGWREPFLGIREPGPWLTAEEFFLPFSGDQLFSHEWSLVGREQDLKGIASFIRGRKQSVGIVVGRGGIGKTRLLRAAALLAEEELSVDARLVATGGEVKPEHFELLPTDPLVVIVDDAHERTDIAPLLAEIHRTRPKAKVLLSLRPYGMTRLALDLRRVGLHPSSLPTWEIGDLRAQDAETLAREVLGSGHSEAVIRRLASLTTDCPLITVVGSGLLKRGLIHPGVLDGDASLRVEILRAFRDALVADPAVGDPELRRLVIDAVAILQPVQSNDPVFQSALEKLCGVPYDRIVPHLRGLEGAGVLLRRGMSLRIVPDLLGDVVLAEACLDDRSGVNTGFIERTRKVAEGEALRHFFVNASRVDWQVRRENAAAQPLVDPLWSLLDEEFRAAGILGRLSLLKLLEKTAYYQPARALALARWALDHPTERSEESDDILARVYSPSYQDVIQALPPVIRYCAYSMEYLADALDLLWRLAQLDDRATNQHPEHALRVLEDLAGYETGKPLAFHERLVDVVERWLDEDPSEDRIRSPFDVLEPMLATEGSDQHSEEFALSFRPYGLNVPAVRTLRARVVAIALKEARHSEPKRALRALEAVGASLHYPVGMFGRPVEPKELDAWTPLFVETIEQLEELAADPTLDPAIGVGIHRTLNWHAHYSTNDTKDAALNVLGRIPTSTENELALLLYDGWGRILFDHFEDYAEGERIKEARFQKLADAIVSKYSDKEAVALLVRRLDVQRRAVGPNEASPGQFVWTLVQTRPSIGEEICRMVARNPDSVLREVVPVALSYLAAARPKKAIALARALVATGSIEVVRCVAQGYGWNRRLRAELAEGEMELLYEFALHEDQWIRSSAVRAAQLMVESHRSQAIDLLTRVRFEDSERLAGEVFATFRGRGDLKWEELSTSQRQAMLNQVRNCPDIDDYDITMFLSQLSEDDPEAVLRLLMERVELSEAEHADRFKALPFRWQKELQLRSSPHFQSMLRGIRDWIAAKLDSWQRRWFGAELFRAVAGKFDDRVIVVLEEAVESGSSEQIEAVAAILREAPRGLVWDVGFVTRLLNGAARQGHEYVKRLGGSLHSAATSGTRSGTPGEPFPEDVELRDRAAEVAKTLPAGSLEERFYTSLRQSAEASIRWDADRDEKLADGRDW
ncbi:MAG: helix-turn-helix domain-containing protein [Actinobacteria bacterium]|nr:helix-turn-helix domain-containing protein [Actinomycetota bacterium]